MTSRSTSPAPAALARRRPDHRPGDERWVGPCAGGRVCLLARSRREYLTVGYTASALAHLTRGQVPREKIGRARTERVARGRTIAVSAIARRGACAAGACPGQPRVRGPRASARLSALPRGANPRRACGPFERLHHRHRGVRARRELRPPGGPGGADRSRAAASRAGTLLSGRGPARSCPDRGSEGPLRSQLLPPHPAHAGTSRLPKHSRPRPSQHADLPHRPAGAQRR